MTALRAGAAFVTSLPWLRAVPHLPAWGRVVLDALFQPLCHHWAGRVLVLGGDAMCVCSRCAGLYAGLALGFLIGGPRLPSNALRMLFIAGGAVMVVDVVTQDVGLHDPSHPVRLVTGAFLGWVVASWMVVATAPSRPTPDPLPRG